MAKKDLIPNEVFRLTSFSFSEFLGDPRQWVLEPFKIGGETLLVGNNSAGKSRILNVIYGLTRLINGEYQKVFESGHYKLTLASDQTLYSYELFIRGHKVVKEELIRGERVLLSRGEGGVGRIWAEKINQEIDFEAPEDQIAAKARRDSIQHPFFEDLYNWADSTRLFPFGSALGRHNLAALSPSMINPTDLSTEVSQAEQVTQLYIRGFKEFGERFDKAILRDLSLLGYECSDVGARTDQFAGIDTPVVLLFVKEKDIKAQVTQLTMSQGMYRAVSLVIQLNFIIFRRKPRMLLIDDIGEGLDYARSKAFVGLLIERAMRYQIQLIMTTNDRFVMNGISLDHWSIVDRKAARVSVINKFNNPEIFEEFPELGLNNFDFFAGQYYRNHSLSDLPNNS